MVPLMSTNCGSELWWRAFRSFNAALGSVNEFIRQIKCIILKFLSYSSTKRHSEPQLFNI